MNDTICTHRDGDLLCPACSVEVLALGHRIVGTGTHLLTELERRRVWVRVAADQARQVAHLNPDPRVMSAIQAAEGWCDGTVSTEQCRAAADAAGWVAARAAAWDAARAYDAKPAQRLALAHRAVDVWCEWAGFTPGTPDAAVTAAAVQRMLEVAL